MPLLDHFRPPILNKGSWEGFHGGWPMTMVMDLCRSLPEQYMAEPRVHLGKSFEVQAFVSKCAALLQKKICVSIVDLVTVKNFNLYCEVLDVFCRTDPAFAPEPPVTYAVTCRSHNLGDRSRFETWAYPMVVGQPLPVLPIWLDNDHAISLDLETSYQQTCQALRLII